MVVIRETEKILVAFPKIEPQMILLLRDRFKANGFDDKRMTDSINHVIDTYSCWDKLPAIADFVSFDIKVKIYTYWELREKYKDRYYPGATYDPIVAEYERIDFRGRECWAKKEDVKQFNLQRFEIKK